MLADNKEQRVCAKFCFLLGKSAAETVLMLQETLIKTQVYEWCSRFKGSECHVRSSQGLAELQPAEMIDANGIVHKEFVPPGHTVNQQFYLKVLERLRDSVRKKTTRNVEQR